MNPTVFEQCIAAKDFDQLYAATSLEFQQLVPSDDFIRTMQEFCHGNDSFHLVYDNPLLNFHHYTWLNDRKDEAISVTFDSNYTIKSLYVCPVETHPMLDRKLTKNTYEMPFLGEWYVFWGGTNQFQNYHYNYPNQRYAYDFVKVLNNSTYSDMPTRNGNYYAYGETVVAPCHGTVVDIEDGIADNAPGDMNKEQPAGNYIVIEHPHNEFSFIAHLEQNSIIVNVGDSVITGQPIARCGNSGNSSEPHIHFHVMNCADFNESTSINIRFSQDAPVQGDLVHYSDYKQKQKQKTDTWDKVETTMTFTDIILLVPRIFLQFFK